jgi:hypothetical protein
VLGARSLAFHRRDKVVIATALVIFFFFLKCEDVPSLWYTTCVPFP